jgi:hypothetical protein
VETSVAADTNTVYVIFTSATSGSPGTMGGAEQLVVMAFSRDGYRRWRLASGPGGAFSRPHLSVRGDLLAIGATFYGHSTLGNFEVVTQGRTDAFISAVHAPTGEVHVAMNFGGDQSDTMVGVTTPTDRRLTFVGWFRSIDHRLGDEAGPNLKVVNVGIDGGLEGRRDLGQGWGTWATLGHDGDKVLVAGQSQYGLRRRHALSDPYPRPGMIVMRGTNRSELDRVVFGDGTDVTIRGVARSGAELLVVGSFSGRLRTGGEQDGHAPLESGIRRNGVLMWVSGPWFD